MTTQKMVDDFFAQKTVALVRASKQGPIHGYSIDTELTKRGYTVFLVSPDANDSDEGKCWLKLVDLPETVGWVIIATPPVLTETYVHQAVDAKITRVWMQHGSESKAAIQLCGEKGIADIHGECVMMFAEPVASVHRFHRWIWKILGKLPK